MEHTHNPNGKPVELSGMFMMQPAGYAIVSVIEDGLQKPALQLDLCGCKRETCTGKVLVMLSSPEATRVIGMALLQAAERFGQPFPTVPSKAN